MRENIAAAMKQALKDKDQAALGHDAAYHGCPERS
jgi:hypothetical protein